jgi:glutamate dehydrogenase (NADP+)
MVCDIALPCATQNEIDQTDAQSLIDNGVQLVAEWANMPSTPEAIALFDKHRILFAPGKASNAWWVATSGLEMSQNAQKLVWTRDEVDQKLQSIMHHIHAQCVHYGAHDDHINYVNGANIAWFVKVADAMIAQGI